MAVGVSVGVFVGVAVLVAVACDVVAVAVGVALVPPLPVLVALVPVALGVAVSPPKVDDGAAVGITLPGGAVGPTSAARPEVGGARSTHSATHSTPSATFRSSKPARQRAASPPALLDGASRREPDSPESVGRASAPSIAFLQSFTASCALALAPDDHGMRGWPVADRG